MVEDRAAISMPKPISYEKVKPQVAQEPPKKTGVISEKQRKLLFAKSKAAGIDQEDFKAYIVNKYGVEHTAELPWTAMDEILKWIDTKAAAPEIAFGDTPDAA